MADVVVACLLTGNRLGGEMGQAFLPVCPAGVIIEEGHNDRACMKSPLFVPAKRHSKLRRLAAPTFVASSMTGNPFRLFRKTSNKRGELFVAQQPVMHRPDSHPGTFLLHSLAEMLRWTGNSPSQK